MLGFDLPQPKMEKQEIMSYVDNWFRNQNISVHVTEAVLLSGGLVNFVWRVKYTNQDNTTQHSIILKQFPDYVRYMPQMKLSQERTAFEYTALEIADIITNSVINDAEYSWKAPKPLFFDKEANIILMQDLGSDLVSLFDYFLDKTDSVIDDKWIPKTILNMITDLSSFSVSDHSSDPGIREKLDVLAMENPVKQLLIADEMKISYYANLNKFGIQPSSEQFDFDSIYQAYIKNHSIKSGLIFGDLWPNSILLDFANKIVYVTDWEVYSESVLY
jgi:hypothetical protein